MTSTKGGVKYMMRDSTLPKSYFFCDACLRDVAQVDLDIVMLPHSHAPKFKLCGECKLFFDRHCRS